MKTMSRILLEKLEKEGSVLFHGSGYKTETLEPHQAYNFADGHKTTDDKPGVHATPFAEIAIFMAVVNKNNLKNFRSSFSYTNKGLFFRMTKKTRDQISNATIGYVYILPKDKFIKRSPAEYISYDSVIPTQIIKVNGDDLPSEISIIPE